jgi:hypothetical protein
MRPLKGKYACPLCDCLLQGDGVAEALELGDEASGGALGVAASEVVAAEVAVGLCGAEHVPDSGQDRVLDGADRAAVPDPGAQALVERLEVGVLRRVAASAACLSASLSHLEPLRMRPERCLPADWWLPGHCPAHDASSLAEGKTLMSTPISATMTSAVRR